VRTPATDHDPFPPHNDDGLFLRRLASVERAAKKSLAFLARSCELYKARASHGPNHNRARHWLAPVARSAKPRPRFPRVRLVAKLSAAAGDRDTHAYDLFTVQQVCWDGRDGQRRRPRERAEVEREGCERGRGGEAAAGAGFRRCARGRIPPAPEEDAQPRPAPPLRVLALFRPCFP
jgi:hypothetical protein